MKTGTIGIVLDYLCMSGAQDQITTVLLIEDEPVIRMGTCAMLEDAGYSVLEACDADEALDILGLHPEISLVITDVQMPGKLDGLKLIEVIGRDYPHIRTLVTSGRTSPQDASDYGASKFISKPYSDTAIQSAVRAILLSH